ncbi:NADH:flavin oxidoreductase [Halovivax ruber XH-70]|uniref:NADH:flavin oxidoreductase n=1 Tax=Halovivax ruber (strain DSM 18193 / JCM 13892 / XH-70) TaxID=797302 RepID=L0IGJ6_HALRX|nr:FAD-dependent monooxygenase [Halovivax ruber]AGB17112.1 NADH:flavin oxidoreductase [Halovivax ruber XH-70]
MQVTVVGGGPAGLYASLLLKKEYPNWEISVSERDPADNTYGWGVVFSDATLSNLKEADTESHERITDAFVRWDPIDVHLKGESIRCGGHTFAGIMRADLLTILQERCRAVGVDLNHDVAIDDPEALEAESDLLIGADGLNSTVRETYEDAFAPSVSSGSAKFAWFGTEKPFDVFTFIFRANEHGLWRVHAYPGRMSTFIVECTEETWDAAGMDEKDEADAIAYLEDLFSDHLDGYDLQSKLYAWRNFPVVECGSWSKRDEVVLLGDAAHTAHFSIGSGTKLALEDAISLLEGFREHGTDVRSALNHYEKERRPRVEGLQAAAERSQSYFENVERYWDLPPEQFAYNLLTRSGRISYDSLKQRDVGYADAYDRWFEAQASVGEGGATTPSDGIEPLAASRPLNQPLTLRETTVDNRLTVTRPPSNGSTDGVPGAAYLDDLRERARGGPGLLLTDPVAVSPDGRITPGTPGLYEDAHVDAWGAFVDEVHAETDTAVGLQLVHAGRRGATRHREYGLDRPLSPEERWELYAPSANPYVPGGPTPTAMDADDCDRIRERFVGAAERAANAGFDYLQLHAGHGYLLSSFLSPLTNDRADEYGGSLEARMRYPLSVFDAVRDAWPDGRPLGAALQATDWNLSGLKTRDSLQVAHEFADRDCDLLSIVAGQATVRERPRYDPTVLADFTETYRNETGVPALSTNYVTTYDEVNTLVGAGRADLCTYRS